MLSLPYAEAPNLGAFPIKTSAIGSSTCRINIGWLTWLDNQDEYLETYWLPLNDSERNSDIVSGLAATDFTGAAMQVSHWTRHLSEYF